jgi:hypothetical protein
LAVHQGCQEHIPSGKGKIECYLKLSSQRFKY